ncbi:diaminopimelate decarboxylase [Holzapfeliella sp. JNUCC 80]
MEHNFNLVTNANHHLEIGGIDTVDLVQKYQTPLVVYDISKIKQQIAGFKSVFEQNDVEYEISYASKAFSCLALYELMQKENLHLDVVSGGELFTAQQAGFDLSKISFHGNNKSFDEIKMAVDAGVGVIVLDNFHEIELLSSYLIDTQQQADVMLRITPGISAHTHDYIQTGQEDSKFGFDLNSGQAEEALTTVLNNPNLTMKGFHSHIGSQIFEVNGFEMAAEKLIDLANDWYQKYSYQPDVINVGGGFGIAYTNDDKPLAPEVFVDAIIKKIKEKTADFGLKMPAIWIEPGRSIVGPAGYNLYTIGSRKEIPGKSAYVSVDGGMGDNIRPALYQAEYEAVIANKMDQEPVENVRVAGKYCESGDILIQKAAFPKTQPGDIVAMINTGAYGYSMASNYNRNLKPAVVFVENGKDNLAIKRQSYQDLIKLENSLY